MQIKYLNLGVMFSGFFGLFIRVISCPTEVLGRAHYIKCLKQALELIFVISEQVFI